MAVARRALPTLALAALAAGCVGDDGLSTPGVDAALQAIEPERIAAHMRYLADDALEGRGTGTPGYLMAAEYVARRFEEIGLEPAGENGGFYQQVPLAGARPPKRAAGSLSTSRQQWLEWMRRFYHTPRDDMSQTIDFTAGATFARFNFLVSYLVANEPRRPSWNPGDFFGERFGP